MDHKFKHGLTGHPLYSVWNGMKRRCTNNKDQAYYNYGGRGISVCDEWHGFLPFYNWAINNGWEKGLTIDRKENDGNYEPDNCRFVTRLVQASNRRNPKRLPKADKDFNGVRLVCRKIRRRKDITQQQLADQIGIAQTTLASFENGRSGVYLKP